jgi:4-carboxymuconolactone decarboxylase
MRLNIKGGSNMQVFDGASAHAHDVLKWLEEGVDKDFADIVNNFSFGGLYRRTILDPKVRQLCTISALTVLNALPQLRSHIRITFAAGASEAEVKEAIIQMATYCGIPYVSQALKAYEEVIQEHGREKR